MEKLRSGGIIIVHIGIAAAVKREQNMELGRGNEGKIVGGGQEPRLDLAFGVES